MENNIVKNEEEILKFWREKKIFEKSVKNRPESKPYVFYDGPPFATGLPHYGHIVASLIKDIVPRYWAMRGYRVERKWGWDCHGLPIENLVEQKLKIKSHKEILDFGVAKFNNECHAMVLQYAAEWKKIIERIGRWVDMENDYKTMDIEYMESVWWVFSELWKKGLIYHGYKPMHICPRCETTLSNFEVTQGYKTVKDTALTVKFKVESSKFKNTYILAWTTTPWTLPGNVALAVGKNIEYVMVEIEDFENYPNGTYIMSKKYADKLGIFNAHAFNPNEDNPLPSFHLFYKTLKGADLVGLEYEPIFPYFKDTKNAFRVVAGDFVTTEDGTGVVHIAPAFGEDDYAVGQKEKIGWVQHVGMDGRFTKDVADFAGTEVKPKEDPTLTDIAILKWLAAKGLIFSKEKYEHSYPHCWRCDSSLLNYATSSWFIKVTELTKELLKNNKKIRWVPEHIKNGRFGKWLEGARDWAVSRNRFWGDPLPIWQSTDGDTICVGSVKELEKLSGEKITDIHKHLMDKIVIKKGDKEYKRVPEVLDCWFESGSMPYGQMHYPFENKKKFEDSFPAEFIAEGQDQTRGWFYTLHVLAAAIFKKPAFKNVIVNGIVLAEDGKKMSKRLKNYPDPMEVVEKYGADTLRFYLATSPVMYSENLNFKELGVSEMWGKLLNTLANVLELYLMNGSRKEKFTKPSNVLDQWLIAKLDNLKSEVTEKMDNYLLAEAGRPMLDFVTELSQWHVRRSRDRIKEKNTEVLGVLRFALLEFAKISAPFIPFMAEHLYKKLGGELESVHLEDWPKVKKISETEKKLLTEMETARKVVEAALSIRKEKGIKVRQPLAELQISECKMQNELLKIIAEEINVHSVIPATCPAKLGERSGKAGIQTDKDWVVKDNVALNVKITPELREEGAVRELTRAVNALRKEASLTPNDKIVLYLDPASEKLFGKFVDEIAKSTVSEKIIFEKNDLKHAGEIKLDDKNVWIGIER